MKYNITLLYYEQAVTENDIKYLFSRSILIAAHHSSVCKFKLNICAVE